MPKKKKKSKKSDKEKKSKKKSSAINERDIVSYEQQIADCNKQLTRLRSRNDELEIETEETREKFIKLGEDRSDVIAHLKRQLHQKTEESRELHEKLSALEELRNEELNECKLKEEKMEEDYRKMENDLTTEIKLAEGKLNTLEEWRLARENMLQKFQVQEQQIEEQEKQHEEKLYQVEKELVLSKTKMEKEMEERIEKLGQEMKDSMNSRIAKSTQRAIQENVDLNKELDIMLKVCKKVDDQLTHFKERDKQLSNQTFVMKSEAKTALKKVAKQNLLIRKLTKEHYSLVFVYSELKATEIASQKNEKLAQEYKLKLEEADENICQLKKQIENARKEKDEILKEIRETCVEAKKLKEILRRAKQFLKCTLNIDELENDKPLDQVFGKEEFFQTLLDILSVDMHETHDKGYKDTVKNRYTRGILGFVPSSGSESQEDGENNEGERKNSSSSEVFSLIESLREVSLEEIDHD